MGLNMNAATVARHPAKAGRSASPSSALALVLGVVLVVGGCASTQNARAPVEERPTSGRPASSSSAATASSPATAASTDPVKPSPPGAENAGKLGYFTVRPGDTLIRVGLETGQNWKDLMKWNNLDNPNVIEVGQVLRVVAPGADPTAVTTRPLASTKVEARPLDVPAATKPVGAAASAPAAGVAAGVTPPAVATPTPPPASTARGDDELNWLWPASGPVVASFDEVKSKGLAISGKAGDPVLAAADGRVVYAGSGLRGYGNLVIIKHNNTYLTAYAHNQALLVKEEQSVRRGQKIAEMGSTDAERVQLHFEIRKQGKPIDPGKLLPSR
jgi:lipoprotein NlpD